MKSHSLGWHPRRISGFTLVELLVVIGIIALLIGILLPTLGKARRSARDIVCANGLRQFVMADNMYLADFRVYPLPSLSTNGTTNGVSNFLAWPYLLDGGMINVLGGYLHVKNPYPNAVAAANAISTPGGPLGTGQANYPIGKQNLDVPALTTAISQGIIPSWTNLPNIYKAPEYTDNFTSAPPTINGSAAGPFTNVAYDVGGYYAYQFTGYTCWVSLTENPTNGKWNRSIASYVVGSSAQPSGSTIDTFMWPNDVGTRKHRGVLWADSVYWYGVGSNWVFTHSKKAGITSSPFPTDIRGQHSAYSDGSVVFNTNTNILTSTNFVTTQLSATMSYANKSFYWATLSR